MVQHLALCRGGTQNREHLLRSLAPPAEEVGVWTTKDLEENLKTMSEFGLVDDDQNAVALTPGAARAAKQGLDAIVDVLRMAVLDRDRNTDPWGGQAGARDLTNSSAWFLSLSFSEAPTGFDSSERSVIELLRRDFGNRNGDEGYWPIVNGSRWPPFIRWACSLGLARSIKFGSTSVLLPDPSIAVGRSLAAVLGDESQMTADGFLDQLAVELPVVDRGEYSEFVRDNMTEKATRSDVSESLSFALRTLERQERVRLVKQDDSPKVSLSDGQLVSHVGRGLSW